MKLGDVVIFRENHKWVGSIGFVNEIKGERIMVGVPQPMQGVAYIFCKEEELESTHYPYPYEIRSKEGDDE